MLTTGRIPSGAAILGNRGVRVSAMTIFVHGRGAVALATVALLAVGGCSKSVDSEADSGDREPTSNVDGVTSPESPTGSPGSADGPSTPGGSDGTAGTPAPVPDEVVADTEDGVEDYVADVGDVMKKPSSDEDLDLDAVTGAALEELRNRVVEYETSGWRVVGEPTVVRHRVVRYRKDPESAVVRACLDNSDVRVVDSEGRTVPGSRPAKPRSLNILTLVKTGDGWAVSEQRLAARPDC